MWASRREGIVSFAYADGSQSNRAELYHQNETKFKEGEDFYLLQLLPAKRRVGSRY